MKITQSKLIIKQKVEAIEIFTGFETKNRYQVFDESGKDLFYAFEESGFFLRQFLSMLRSYTIQVIDNTKQPLLVIQRPFFFFIAKHTVKAGDGGVMGYINQKFKFFEKRLEILDANNGVIFTLSAKITHPWTFKVLKDDRQVAEIKKKWSGFGKEMFTDADTFFIDFGEVSKDTEKTLLLASAFAIDVRFFERSSR